MDSAPHGDDDSGELISLLDSVPSVDGTFPLHGTVFSADTAELHIHTT